jgi:hypothetical protein
MTPKQMSAVAMVLAVALFVAPSLHAQTEGGKPGAASVAGSAPPDKTLAKPAPDAEDKAPSSASGSSGQSILPREEGKAAAPEPGMAGRAKVQDDRSTLMGQSKAIPDEQRDVKPDGEIAPSR